MISQVAKVARPSQTLMPSNTPSAVATPLPPTKRKKIGHRWPRKTAIATSATAVSPTPRALSKCEARNTASQPLAPSPSKVMMAAPLLPLRSTLVAPGFFEPGARIGNAENLAHHHGKRYRAEQVSGHCHCQGCDYWIHFFPLLIISLTSRPGQQNIHQVATR